MAERLNAGPGDHLQFLKSSSFLLLSTSPTILDVNPHPSLKAGDDKLWPVGQIWPVICFCNEVLSEHIHDHLQIIYGCFCNYGSGDRLYGPRKLKYLLSALLQAKGANFCSSCLLSFLLFFPIDSSCLTWTTAVASKLVAVGMSFL